MKILGRNFIIRQLTPFVLISLIAPGCAAKTPIEQVPKEVLEAQTSTEKQAPKPKWVEGESKEYPRLDYMWARAQGKSSSEATANAKNKLTKMFMVDVNEFNMSQHQAKISAGYENVEALSSSESMIVALPESQEVADKINVVDTWHDLANKTYYAYAVLPRNIGKSFLRQEISRLDTLTSELIDKSQTESDTFSQLGLMAKAWRAQQIREAMQKTMTRADLTGRGIKPKWRLKDMERDMDTILKGLRIYPTGLEEDMNARLMTGILQGALKVAELTPADEASAHYILRAVVDTSIIGEENGWAIGHGAVKVALTEKSDNKPRGATQWELQTPGLNENHAERRVLEKTEYSLKKNMRNILIDMAMD